ncbi:MAG TPA: 3-oxoadipate enol-lactonase [Ramlibacter sp.]|nr:3-oxoadipate enol-lactonase [Ramlibacter sp.]
MSTTRAAPNHDATSNGALRKARLPRGVEIAYRIDGPPDAPVVLLAHGLLADHSVWDAVATRLAARFRVLRPDLRGHGASPAPPPPYTLAQLGEDLLALLDELHIAQAHLVGSSMGGMLAQPVAARHGKRLLSLTLATTAAEQLGAAAWQERIDLVRHQGVKALADATLERWLTPAFRERAPEQAACLRASMLRTSDDGYVGCASAVRDLDHLPLLAQIHVPTLVIAGAQDLATPPAQSLQLQQGIAGARLVTLDAGHQAAFEQPEAFCEAWLAFIDKLPLAAAAS